MVGTSLNNVVKLFLQQHDEQKLHGRHISAIQSICSQNASGFLLRDLPAVVQILQVVIQLIVRGAAHFVSPACSLLRTLAKPYSKCTSTDELKLQPIFTGLFNTLAVILQPEVPHELQECTAELLADFSAAYNNRPDVLEVDQAAAATADPQSTLRLYQTHQSLLHQSNMGPAVTALLQALVVAAPSSSSSCCSQQGSSPEANSSSRPASTSRLETGARSSLICALVSALVNFSYSAKLSEQLLEHGVLLVLVQLLHAHVGSESSQATKLVNRIIVLLWNLLELAPAAAQQALSPSQRIVHAGLTTQQQIHIAEQQRGMHACDLNNQPPWSTGTATESAVTADTWARQSACRSCSTTTPATSVPYAHAREAAAPEIAMPAASAENRLQQDGPAGGDELQGSAASCIGASQASVRSETPCSKVAVGLIDALTSLFKKQLQNVSSKQAKEQRNDTLAVLQHLSSMACCCPAFTASSFLPLAIAAATTPELQPSSQHVPAGALTKEPEDHELKLLLWGVLGNAAASNGTCLAAAAPALLRTLLLVVDESAGQSCFAVGRWSPEQLLALRKMAWSVLQQVAPLCKAEFCACGGARMLVRHISCCYNTNCSTEWVPRNCSSPGSRSNSVAMITANFASQAGFISGRCGSFSGRQSCTTFEPALRLLQRLMAADASMAEAFADQGLVSALLEFLQAPVCSDAAGSKQGVLLLLAEMCAAGGSSCTSRLLQAGGVGLLLKECQAVLEADACQPNLAGLAALDAIWRCVLPRASSRAQLLALDGMDVLLGLLQQGKTHLRPVVLSVLADLLADKRAHPFFLEWNAPAANPPGSAAAAAPPSGTLAPSIGRLAGTGMSRNTGTTSVSATQLLINIWREQDQARGLSGPDGLLASSSRPLVAAGSRSRWCVEDATVNGVHGVMQPECKAVLQRIAAASTPDLMCDKVYACLAPLGFDSLASMLQPADAAVLCFIRQYVKFRQGEVWQGIAAEFEAVGIAPTQEDMLRVASGIQHSELIAAQVQREQAALLAAVWAKELAAEQAEYTAMLAQAAADARSKVWQKDASKLTMRERLAAKARKEEMLKHSIASSISAAVAAVPGTIPAPAAWSGAQEGIAL